MTNKGSLLEEPASKRQVPTIKEENERIRATYQKQGSVHVIVAEGEIDCYTIPNFKRCIEPVIEGYQAGETVEVHLEKGFRHCDDTVNGGVHYMEGSGFGALISAFKKVRQKVSDAESFHIYTDNGTVAKVIRFTWLNRVFNVHDRS